jgi:hypothetical protein
MQKEPSSFQIHAWLAWALLIGLGVVLVMFVPVVEFYRVRTQNIVEYLDLWRDINVVGDGLSDWQWLLFLFTAVLAMYRISRGEIKQDGRGWLVFFVGGLLFAIAVRLGDIPRVACLGLPMMLYGGARHIFGPVGKCMFIPSLILLLIIPLHQITWLETIFFSGVKSVLLWTCGTVVHGQTHFFLCNDIYYGAVVRDTVTSLLLLFFLSRMRAPKMALTALLVLIWSYVAAAGVYAFAFRFPAVFHDMYAISVARSAGWMLPLMILAYDVFRRRYQKSVIP